jgi:hypothetical protein
MGTSAGVERATGEEWAETGAEILAGSEEAEAVIGAGEDSGVDEAVLARGIDAARIARRGSTGRDTATGARIGVGAGLGPGDSPKAAMRACVEGSSQLAGRGWYWAGAVAAWGAAGTGAETLEVGIARRMIGRGCAGRAHRLDEARAGVDDGVAGVGAGAGAGAGVMAGTGAERAEADAATTIGAGDGADDDILEEIEVGARRGSTGRVDLGGGGLGAGVGTRLATGVGARVGTELGSTPEGFRIRLLLERMAMLVAGLRRALRVCGESHMEGILQTSICEERHLGVQQILHAQKTQTNWLGTKVDEPRIPFLQGTRQVSRQSRLGYRLMELDD